MPSIEESAEAFDGLMARFKFPEAFNRSGRGELFILQYLHEKGTPAIPSELSETLKSSAARISMVLRTLEKKELIFREVDPSNRRNVLVTITQKGSERICAFKEQMKKHLLDVFEEMGQEDASELVRLLERFFEIGYANRPNLSIEPE